MRTLRVVPALTCVGVLGASNAGILILGGGESTRAYTVYRAVGLAIAIALVVVRWRALAPLLIRERTVLLFSVWSLATLLWTQNLRDSAVALAVLATQVVLAAALATEFRPRLAMNLVAGLLTACSAISIGLIVFAPSIGTNEVDHVTAGRITQGIGVFGWNSELGIASAIGVVVCAGLLAVTRWWWFAGMLVVNAVALYFTDSATSIMAAAAGLAAVGFLAFRLIRIVAALGLVGASLLLTLGLGDWFFDTLLSLFNRTSSLSGREGIWVATIDEIRKEPWGGHGVGTSPDYMLLILRTLAHAHNGYLQVAYDRGLVGAAFLAAILIIASVRLWTAPAETTVLAGPLFVVVLITNYVNNYLVSAGLAALLLYWVVFAAAAAPRVQGPRLNGRFRIPRKKPR